MAFVSTPNAILAQSAPANDNFVNAMVISGSSETTNVVFGSNVNATREPSEPYHGHGSASASVWWTWTATTTRSISISTEGSSYDTLLGVYTGTSVANLATVTVNDDQDGLQTSRVLFRAVAGETYMIAVDGFSGETGFIQLTVAPAGIFSPLTWDGVDIQGHPVSSFALLDRVRLLDFWSVTCPPCLEELPHFVNLYNRLNPAGFRVVGLFKNTSLSDVNGLISNLGISFPMLDLTPTIEGILAPLQTGAPTTIQAFPTTYVYDRENRLVAQVMGAAKDLAYFENLLLPLMRTSSSISFKGTWTPGGLHLSWGGADKGDLLESTSDLSSTNWTQVLSIYGQTEMTLPLEENARFYRIRRPTSQ